MLGVVCQRDSNLMYTSFRPAVYVWEKFDFRILDNFVVYLQKHHLFPYRVFFLIVIENKTASFVFENSIWWSEN